MAIDSFPDIIYYTDPLKDEFSTMEITPRRIDGSYRYLRDGFFGRILHFLTFRLIGKPIGWIYLHNKFHHTIVGKEKLKPFKKQAIFLFGNHTQIIGDALMPAFMVSPRSINVIVHPNNVSIPHLGKYVPYLGGFPLPDDIEAGKNFMNAIDKRVKQKQPIFIYPEAHLWPYYTGIRPFVSTSFVYPIKYKTPTFCFTNTYHRGKKGKVNIITYIDGPFYPDEGLSLKEAKENLRNKVYKTMCERATLSTYEAVKYLPKEESK